MIELSTFYRKWKTVLLDGPTGAVKRESVSKNMRDEMYNDQDGECTYCNKALTQSPADFDLDHIIPVKHGGPTCRSNLHLLCVRCHRQKSATERRSGAKPYRPMYASDSVVVRIDPGFPSVRPIDLPRLKPGIYSLIYGPHKPPRPAVEQRVDKRVTRSAKVVPENKSGFLSVARKAGKPKNRRTLHTESGSQDRPTLPRGGVTGWLKPKK